jgi:hypothetical protein
MKEPKLTPEIIKKYYPLKGVGTFVSIVNRLGGRYRRIPIGIKRPGREASHSLPSNAGVKNGGNVPPLPPYVFMACQLIQHRGSFTFTLWGGRPENCYSIPSKSRDLFLQRPDRPVSYKIGTVEKDKVVGT